MGDPALFADDPQPEEPQDLTPEDPQPDPDPSPDPDPDPSPDPDPQPDPEDRPGWLPEKFKTGEDLAKSYKELETKYRNKYGAPDEYELEYIEGQTVPEELLTQFKDSNLTNEQAQRMLNMYKDELIPEMMHLKREVEEQKLLTAWETKDTDEAAQRTQKVLLWSEKHLGKEVTAQHKSSASGVLYLEAEMRRKLNSDRTDDRTSKATSSNSLGYTRADLQKRMKDPRFNKYSDKYDPDFHRETAALALALEDE